MQSLTFESPLVRAEPSWVLVVDGDPNDRMQAFRLLEREGLHATVAENGRAALDLLAAEPFDLVLLDLTLPGREGFEVLSTIRNDHRLSQIPVVVTGPRGDADGMVGSLELGADDYVPKPFEPAVVRLRVDVALTKKRLRDCLVGYLDAMSHVAEAATALTRGGSDPAALRLLARRADPLGRLARVVLDMAAELETSSRRTAHPSRKRQPATSAGGERGDGVA
ncbi:MAG: response regulator [Actinomycetota bacterium]|jgi:two-component system, cell cycle response regulator